MAGHDAGGGGVRKEERMLSSTERVVNRHSHDTDRSSTRIFQHFLKQTPYKYSTVVMYQAQT